MSALSSTAISFSIPDDWPEQAKTENQPPPFFFQSLLPELQNLICTQLDVPTRCSLSWTCRHYHMAYGDKDFDPFDFADKCAELGYRTLLQYSINRGGPFDVETSNVAAAHGNIDVLRLFVWLKFQNHLEIFLDGVNGYVREWAIAAARTGRTVFLNWLRVAEWSSAGDLRHIADAALEQAQNIALEVLQRVKAISHTEGQQLGVALLSKAYEFGDSHIEVVQRIWEMGYKFNPFSQPYVHPTVMSLYLDNHPDVELESKLPALCNMGKTSGDAALIRLAVERGATISLDDFEPRSNNGELPKPQVLRYLHERFGLASAPFKERYAIPQRVSKADLQWMHEQGYKFEMKNCSSHYLRDSELLPSLFQMGFRPTYKDIRDAAINCRLDLLDVLFRNANEYEISDTLLISIFLKGMADKVHKSRFGLKRILKTLRLLLDHHYPLGIGAEGRDTSACDHFVRALIDHRPRLFRASFEIISALNMPLSSETRERVAKLIAGTDTGTTPKGSEGQ